MVHRRPGRRRRRRRPRLASASYAIFGQPAAPPPSTLGTHAGRGCGEAVFAVQPPCAARAAASGHPHKREPRGSGRGPLTWPPARYSSHACLGTARATQGAVRARHWGFEGCGQSNSSLGTACPVRLLRPPQAPTAVNAPIQPCSGGATACNGLAAGGAGRTMGLRTRCCGGDAMAAVTEQAPGGRRSAERWEEACDERSGVQARR